MNARRRPDAIGQAAELLANATSSAQLRAALTPLGETIEANLAPGARYALFLRAPSSPVAHLRSNLADAELAKLLRAYLKYLEQRGAD